MKKTFIYSLVVAAFLVGCGDKEGGTITDSVKEAAHSVADKPKEVAGNAVEVTKDAASAVADKAVESAKDAGSVVAEKASRAVEATKEVASDVADKAVEVAKDAGTAVAEKASEAATTATAAEASTGDAVAGKAAYAKCVACHGVNAEKKALGASKVIAGWEAGKIDTSLKGYKDGSYGGAMKGVMKGQVVSMSDADIANVSAYISGLK
jgi:cytochrome c553